MFAGYSSGWPKYTTVRDHIENIQSWEGIDTHGGQYLYFQDNYIKNCRTGVFMQLVNGSGGLAAIGDHLYVQRNVIEMPASPIYATPQYFILVTPGDPTYIYRMTYIFIEDNVLYFTTRPSADHLHGGIAVENTDGITISGNQITNGSAVLQSDSTKVHIKSITGSVATSTITDAVIQNNYIAGWEPWDSRLG